jgi:hypothetical protein
MSDADESDDRGPRFADPYSGALKQSARSIEERGEDDACYMPRRPQQRLRKLNWILGISVSVG